MVGRSLEKPASGHQGPLWLASHQLLLLVVVLLLLLLLFWGERLVRPWRWPLAWMDRTRQRMPECGEGADFGRPYLPKKQPLPACPRSSTLNLPLTSPSLKALIFKMDQRKFLV